MEFGFGNQDCHDKKDGMSAELSCAVIGAGVTGASAAYALARRGVDVTVFEQFGLGHDKASSHGATRLFRTAYFEHPDYVPLLLQAENAWRALENEAGETLFQQTGVMIGGPKHSNIIRNIKLAADTHQLTVHDLNRADVTSLFEWMDTSKIERAIIEPAAGIIFADRAINAFTTLAQKQGVKFIDHAQIDAWRPTRDGIALVVDGDLHRFDRLVIAAGAYAQSCWAKSECE